VPCGCSGASATVTPPQARRRVAMARALCMQPKIMLFDEPASALDPEMVKEVPDTIVELASHIPEDHANPARWKGHLAKLQPEPKQVARGHQKALAYVGARLGISCVEGRPHRRDAVGAVARGRSCERDQLGKASLTAKTRPTSSLRRRNIESTFLAPLGLEMLVAAEAGSGRRALNRWCA
jgi:hypothetical protein